MAEVIARAEMIAMLHELDKALVQPVQMVICGGSAAILNMGLARRSMDIDIMASTVPLAAPDIQSAIAMIAARHSRGPHWLNDDARVVRDRLPPSYQPETEEIAGETFATLQPRVVTKAEFIVTKLVIHEHIRQRDIRDIAELAFGGPEFAALWRRLNAIAVSGQVLALTIESHFKSIRPEFAIDQDGFAIAGAHEVAEYLRTRYGVCAGAEEQSEWSDAIDGHTRKAGSIVALKDLEMARLIDLGDTRIAASDKAYRQAERAP